MLQILRIPSYTFGQQKRKQFVLNRPNQSAISITTQHMSSTFVLSHVITSHACSSFIQELDIKSTESESAVENIPVK